MPEQCSYSHDRAVVVGGSMVGMAVARALSGHFREVVMLEKDKHEHDTPYHRPGVPQSYHIHNLTLRGQRELDALFPGYTEEAVALGAMVIDYGRDVARSSKLGFQPQIESRLVALSATRALLECAQRRRLLALTPNLRVLDGTRVLELLVAEEAGKKRAVGVLTSHPEHAEIRADLVVDCSGRNANWKDWFRAHRLTLPRETVVDSRCGYSSRFYRPKNPEAFPWKALIVDGAFPDHPHWGVIVPLERGEWVVTLGGIGGNYPPSDETGFMECARNLMTPAYAKALEDAEPLTPVRTFRRMEMRWSHFESHKHELSSFLALGDAIWSYNPLYGQGMTIGVTCAGILRDELNKDPRLSNLAHRLYPRAKKFAFQPWESTALLDMRWPKTTGKRPWHAKLSYWLFDLMWLATHYDPAVCQAGIEAIHLTRQPHEIITPRILWGTLKVALRRYLLANLPVLPQLPQGPVSSLDVPPRKPLLLEG